MESPIHGYPGCHRPVSSSPLAPKKNPAHLGSAMHEVTKKPDVARYLMEMCALHEIVALGHTCKNLRPVAFDVTRSRFKSLIQPFFPLRNSEFPTVLQRTKSVVTGSAALAMLLKPSDIAEAPRDLNLVVPKGSYKQLVDWIIDNGYSIDEDYETKSCLSRYIKTFTAFAFGQQMVTVTECICSDVLDVIVNSPSTADMAFMTGGGIVTLYPGLTLSLKTILSYTGLGVLKSDELLGCMSSSNFAVHKSSKFLSHPCGALCPVAWRHAGTDGALTCMDWDLRFSIRSVVKESNADWRLGATCKNRHCLNYFKDTDTAADVFTIRTPPSLIYDVEPRKELIGNHKPVHAGAYDGLLYATLCTEPIIVPVPISVGVSQVKSLLNLDVEYWVKQRENCANNSHRVHLMKSFVSMDHSYTMFIDNPRMFPPYNILANTIAPPKNRETPYYGNILVLKHSHLEFHSAESVPHRRCTTGEGQELRPDFVRHALVIGYSLCYTTIMHVKWPVFVLTSMGPSASNEGGFPDTITLDREARNCDSGYDLNFLVACETEENLNSTTSALTTAYKIRQKHSNLLNVCPEPTVRAVMIATGCARPSLVHVPVRQSHQLAVDYWLPLTREFTEEDLSGDDVMHFNIHGFPAIDNYSFPFTYSIYFLARGPENMCVSRFCRDPLQSPARGDVLVVKMVEGQPIDATNDDFNLACALTAVSSTLGAPRYFNN
ncbi:hypothetical protein BJ138DRAFT_1213806 [Hygrophoropsis aurantiaca]|uniref:Uncharacterized protein n=1 Tax=Hygrophoropsis aurantiaca TaxID=72124 RepID=A0ACB8A3E2_9AGAM|nr:hypothetical protein BJ138DRAFT_1213806 [Hygrophoropsis aurantiaca]